MGQQHQLVDLVIVTVFKPRRRRFYTSRSWIFQFQAVVTREGILPGDLVPKLWGSLALKL
jgi:hypothetical protein